MEIKSFTELLQHTCCYIFFGVSVEINSFTDRLQRDPYQVSGAWCIASTEPPWWRTYVFEFFSVDWSKYLRLYPYWAHGWRLHGHYVVHLSVNSLVSST